jgi:acetate kinase
LDNVVAMQNASALKPSDSGVLTINGGSSSIKFAVFSTDDGRVGQRVLSGQIERIGSDGTALKSKATDGSPAIDRPISARSHGDAVGALAGFLDERLGGERPLAIGHRIVHGGRNHFDPERVTPQLMEDLHQAVALDPAHLPQEIELIEAFARRYPDLPQIACFDTAFFRDLPRVAQLLPVPRDLEREGVRRYGFHGLSYTFLMKELARVAGTEVAKGRVILAHLGAGASLAAVRDGKPIDTTMAFTPTAGLVMATRTGDMDPGVLIYLMRSRGMNADQIDDLVNRKSGLLGVSQISGDMRDLTARRQSDARADEAVSLFCAQIRKFIGAFAAALGGLDTLVFAGGIGEHAADIRAEICGKLEFLGIQIDAARNAANAPIISSDTTRVAVRVIATDEESVIADAVVRSIAR